MRGDGAAQRRRLRRVKHLTQPARHLARQGGVQTQRGEQRRATRRERARVARVPRVAPRKERGERGAHVPRGREEVGGGARWAAVERPLGLRQLGERGGCGRRRRRARAGGFAGARLCGAAGGARGGRQPRQQPAPLDERARGGGRSGGARDDGERGLPGVRVAGEGGGSVRHEHLRGERLAEQPRVLRPSAQAGEEQPEHPDAERAGLPPRRAYDGGVFRAVAATAAARPVERAQEVHGERLAVQRRAAVHRALRDDVRVAGGVQRRRRRLRGEHRRRRGETRDIRDPGICRCLIRAVLVLVCVCRTRKTGGENLVVVAPSLPRLGRAEHRLAIRRALGRESVPGRRQQRGELRALPEVGRLWPLRLVARLAQRVERREGNRARGLVRGRRRRERHARQAPPRGVARLQAPAPQPRQRKREHPGGVVRVRGRAAAKRAPLLRQTLPAQLLERLGGGVGAERRARRRRRRDARVREPRRRRRAPPRIRGRARARRRGDSRGGEVAAREREGTDTDAWVPVPVITCRLPECDVSARQVRRGVAPEVPHGAKRAAARGGVHLDKHRAQPPVARRESRAVRGGEQRDERGLLRAPHSVVRGGKLLGVVDVVLRRRREENLVRVEVVAGRRRGFAVQAPQRVERAHELDFRGARDAVVARRGGGGDGVRERLFRLDAFRVILRVILLCAELHAELCAELRVLVVVRRRQQGRQRRGHRRDRRRQRRVRAGVQQHARRRGVRGETLERVARERGEVARQDAIRSGFGHHGSGFGFEDAPTRKRRERRRRPPDKRRRRDASGVPEPPAERGPSEPARGGHQRRRRDASERVPARVQERVQIRRDGTLGGGGARGARRAAARCIGEERRDALRAPLRARRRRRRDHQGQHAQGRQETRGVRRRRARRRGRG